MEPQTRAADAPEYLFLFVFVAQPPDKARQEKTEGEGGSKNKINHRKLLLCAEMKNGHEEKHARPAFALPLSRLQHNNFGTLHNPRMTEWLRCTPAWFWPLRLLMSPGETSSG